MTLLVAFYLGNLLGPPPPSEEMIATAETAMWLLVLWAYWVEKHRTSTEENQPSST